MYKQRWCQLIKFWATVSPQAIMLIYLVAALLMWITEIDPEITVFPVEVRMGLQIAAVSISILCLAWPAANAAYIKSMNPDHEDIQNVQFEGSFNTSCALYAAFAFIFVTGVLDGVSEPMTWLIFAVFSAVPLALLLYFWQVSKIMMLAADRPLMLGDLFQLVAGLICLPISIFQLQKWPKQAAKRNSVSP